MSLAELRASLGGGGESTPAVDQTPSEEEPRGVASVVTPSGLEIYYQAAPKRLYRIKPYLPARVAKRPHSETDPQWSEEFSVGAWEEVPSVSTVLEVLEKGGLSWWGMKVGVEGVLELIRRAGETQLDIDDNTGELVEINPAGGRVLTAEDVVDLLKSAKLTVNHVKGAAADRGTNVHSALESFAETGVIPDPQFFPESERGYVEGLVAFLNDVEVTHHQSEVMVASSDGWAGRFDWVVSIAGEVVVKTYPKRKPIRAAVSGKWLLDLKTSKGVYPSYKIQTAAYRQGLEDCGYDPVDHAGVVRVTADGKYELVESEATYEDFLTVLETYRTIARLS